MSQPSRLGKILIWLYVAVFLAGMAADQVVQWWGLWP